MFKPRAGFAPQTQPKNLKYQNTKNLNPKKKVKPVCAHIYMWRLRVRACACVLPCIYIYIHIYIYAGGERLCLCAWVLPYIHTYIYVCIYGSTHAHRHRRSPPAYMYICIYIYIHGSTHAHARTRNLHIYICAHTGLTFFFGFRFLVFWYFRFLGWVWGANPARGLNIWFFGLAPLRPKA